MFVAFVVLPQQPEAQEGKYLHELDGNDWMSWVIPQKVTWVEGFMTAQQAVIFAVQQLDLSPEEKSLYSNFLYIPEPAHIVAQRVEYYYQSTGDLQARIWSVIYVIYGKNWWGLETEKNGSGEPEPSFDPPQPEPKFVPEPNGLPIDPKARQALAYFILTRS